MAQLGKAGIRIKLTPPMRRAKAPRCFSAPPRRAPRAWRSSRRGPDPSQEYDNLFGKDAYFNAGNVELPGFRELLDATMATTDQAQRKEAFAKLQRFEVENALMVTFLLCTEPCRSIRPR